MKKITVIFLIFILALFLAGVWSGCKQEDEKGMLDRSKITVSDKGDAVQAGEVTWTLIESEYLGSLIVNDEDSGSLETESGRFLSLRFKVINNSDEPRSIIDVKIIDSNGEEYPICIDAYGYIAVEEACVLEELLPGIERTFTATYDVPLDAVDLLMEVTDLKYPPEDMAYIDLGL